MKKVVTISVLFLSILILVAFFIKEYAIQYNVNGVKIREEYKSDRYIFNINKHYILDIYSDKIINKHLINKAKVIKDKNYECILLESEKLDVYPVCSNNKKQISIDLVKSNKLNKYLKVKKDNNSSNKDFKYFNNLDKNTYIAVWKYNGFYIMNGEKIKTLHIFNTDRYSNDLCVNINNYIFLPNYDEKHTFKNYYIVDMKNGDYEKIKIDKEIDYDSVILGKYNNEIYLYDKKYKKEYKINIKKKKIYEIGSLADGFIAYKGGKEKKVKWSDLEKEKFTFNEKEYYKYKNDNGLIKIYNNKSNNKIKIYNKKVYLISDYQDKLYFLDKEYLIKYNPKYGSKRIIKNFEWDFNKKNTVFIYNE